MAMIYVDGQAVEVDGNTNLLQACLQAGFDLPYFCWHPALGSVGSCRQCAVTQYRDENDDQGSLVMSCMTPAAEGTRISIADPEASDFRASVIEWMMTQHPHDCPVCEEGGECHLQDMTVMTGHNYRRYRFGKRTFRNQDLGPFIGHEMNRCITCYRCVRFYNDYAGGTDLAAFGQRNQVYFGRQEDGPLESEFSGNLAEVCPTGVFTDKTLEERYTRKWDLRTAPSVCTHCSLGCNISPGERYGVLRRVQNRYNGHVNGYFLCDRGRFGYDFVNSDERIRKPRARGADGSTEMADGELLERIAQMAEGTALIGIGSPRASVETNFALKQLVGEANFYTGMSRAQQRRVELAREILAEGPVRTPATAETENADAVLVLGEDVTATAPRLALSLRQSVRNAGFERAEELQVPLWRDATVRELERHYRSPLFQVVPWATRLDDTARRNLYRAPEDIARLGHAIAHAIDSSAPEPQGLSDAELAQARDIADTLKQARRPLVVSGTEVHSEAVLHAAANVSRALAGQHSDPEQVGITLALPEANSLGQALLGGGDLDEALDHLGAGGHTLVVAENDLFRRVDGDRLRAAFRASRQVIVLDQLENDTVEQGSAVLPAGTFAEASGTLVNNEGRAQRFFRVFEPDTVIRESWRWLVALAGALGREESMLWTRLDEVIDACARDCPELGGIVDAAPRADHRVQGLSAAREPARYSGRTAMNATVDVHEPGPPEDEDTPMTFTMEGYRGPGHTDPNLIATTWSPGWNSEQSVNKFQAEINGAMAGGDQGRRLIQPAGSGEWYPAAVAERDEGWQALPYFAFFGSEELSAASEPIRKRVTDAWLGLAPEVLAERELDEGTDIELRLNGVSVSLPVRALEGLSADSVAVPVGMTELPDHDLPAVCEPVWPEAR
jgi:NADH-quinone oxidoreductase subunit G